MTEYLLLQAGGQHLVLRRATRQYAQPVIVSMPIDEVVAGNNYGYSPVVTDDDLGDTHTWSLVDYPTGMTIDEDTGLVSWAPDIDDVGQHNVVIKVTDSHGEVGYQSYTLEVTPELQRYAPVFTSTPVVTGTEMQAYSYTATASDNDPEDTQAWSLDTKPTGMTINASTGVVSWTPNSSQSGTHAVVIRVTDSFDLYATQSFNVEVNEPPHPSIPELETWEAKMLEFGEYHYSLTDAYIAAGATINHAFYYDSQRVYLNIYDYTGDSKWLTYSSTMADYVRDTFYLFYDGYVQGFNNFTHGFAEDWLRNGDQLSKNAVYLLATNAAFCRDTDPLSASVNADLSREVAYAIESYINAERCGAARRARLVMLFEQALGHLDQWFVDESDPIFAPFMFGLTAEALIMYWDYVAQDPRILSKIQAGADWIWDNAWVAENEAFWYRLNDQLNGVDLNQLISPVFAWLYLRTGDTKYRDRGDQVFAGGAKYAWLGSIGYEYHGAPKVFNQNYRWSFKYLEYRQQAEA